MGFKVRRARRRAEWDAICDRCGLCCYDRKRVFGKGVVILWRRPCPYLQISSGLCKVYSRRFSVCRDCRKVTIFHALFDRYMPESCAYVERFRRFSRRREPGIPAEK
jgi:uncharacterized protein